MIQTLKAANRRILVMGHRGARGLAPENTIASFETARKIGVDFVELDVHVSKDAHLIVMHDARVDRTTDGHGYIKEMSLSEIKALDAGSRFDPRYTGEMVPTLAEILEWSGGGMPLVIELKGGFEQGLVQKVIDLLWRYGVANEAILISFDHRALQHVKALSPEIRTGLLYVARLADPIAVARGSVADALHLNWNYVDHALVREAHAAGLALSAWTVNEPENMRTLIEMGVDSIATDYPDRLVAVAEEIDQAG